MAHLHNGKLTGEHRASDIGQLSLFCFFVAFWMSDMFLEYSSFINEHMPLVVRLPIGILLLIISGYMAGTGHSIVFGKKAQLQGVIRKDVFRFVRHPMNLSEIILYLGFIITSLFSSCGFYLGNSHIISTLHLSL